MRKTPHLRALLRSKRLGVCFMHTGGARQMGAWQIASVMVKAWDGIEAHAATHEPPFLAPVQANGRIIEV